MKDQENGRYGQHGQTEPSIPSISSITEAQIEQAALAWLKALGYATFSGPEIAPGEPAAERDNYGQVVLECRLRQALQRLNP